MTTVLKKRTVKLIYFIGIDVSKNKLDFAVVRERQLLIHQVTANTPDEIHRVVCTLRELDGFKMSKAVFCMENTGFYGNHLLTVLKREKAKIVRENAIHIKQSMGLVRGKDDKVDAIRIAKFAQKNREELRLWVPRRPVMMRLESLVTTKERLMGLRVALKTPLGEQQDFIAKGVHKDIVLLCARSLSALEADILNIEKKIELLLDGDERLKRLMELVTSVHSIGPITARQFIICTNEFIDITEARKFACYAGVAPFKKESGKLIFKSRVSQMANKKMKSLLHMCALVSLQSDTPLRRYFDRKTKIDGKPGMSVVNAVRNKLILRVFACVRQNRTYQQDYLPEGPHPGG